MTEHYFKLKRNAITHAEEARARGLIAVLKPHKSHGYKYCVYVYRKE